MLTGYAKTYTTYLKTSLPSLSAKIYQENTLLDQTMGSTSTLYMSTFRGSHIIKPRRE